MVEVSDALLADVEWRMKQFGTDWKTASPEKTYSVWAESRRELLKLIREIPTTAHQNETLEPFRGRYEGERIFVIGNGPSLNDTDLTQLGSEYTFAVNRFYLMYNRLAWRPTFWTCNDWEVTGDNLQDFFDLGDSTIFWPTRFNGALEPHLDSIAVNTRLPRTPNDDFSIDATDGVVMGDTVLNLVLQLCGFMGFSEIYLIGVDVSYVVDQSVTQHGKLFENGVRQFLQSTEADQNHFDPSYFGPGKRWHNPRPEKMMDAFKRCGDRLEESGIKLYNATVGGALEDLPRVPFDDLFIDGSDNPIVSVIIPAYNAEASIEKAVASVQRQNYRNWEIIIVDDGSHDDTRLIADRLADSDDRISVISQENSGRSAARNSGIDAAQGEYLVFLDADDTLLGTKFARQVAVFREHPEASAVVGGFLRTDALGRVVRRKTFKPKYLKRSDFWSGAPFQIGAAMFRARFLDSEAFDTDIRHAEDWEMLMRFATSEGVRIFAHEGVVCRYMLSEQAKSKGNLDFGLGHIDIVETYMQRHATIDEWVEAYPISRKLVGCRVAARAVVAGNIEDARELMQLTMAAVPSERAEYARLLRSQIRFWRKQLSSTSALPLERLTKEVMDNSELADIR